MKKQKQEKMIQVICPNDMEKPVLYFDDRQQALDFAQTYESGAFVSPKPELVPERIVRNKSMHIAKHGHRL